MAWRNLFLDKDDHIRGLNHIASLFTTSYSSSPFFVPLDYLSSLPIEYLIVGGLARSFYATARNTDDIDILLKSEADVEKFTKLTAGVLRKVRKHAFTHGHVEIETLTPEYLGLPADIASYIFEHSEDFSYSGGSAGKVLSPEGLILMKLFALKSSPTPEKHKDDIVSVMKSQGPSLDYQSIRELAGSISPEAVEFIDTAINGLQREFKDF